MSTAFRNWQQKRLPEMEQAGRLHAETEPRSVNTYVQKVDDDVAPYDNYPKGWHALGNALSSLNGTLRKTHAVKQERWTKEQIAEGERMWAENKINWRKFSNMNPDLAGLNPHLQRGYQAAELKARGMEFSHDMQTWYTTSGLMNETDPAKVQAAVREFSENYINNTINRTQYQDSELVSEHFLAPARQAEAALLARHTGDMSNEHLKLSAEKLTHLASAHMDNMINNTPNIANPTNFNAALVPLAEQFMAASDEMIANGMPKSLVNKIILEAVLDYANGIKGGNLGYGDELLAVLDHIKIGTGMLGGTAEAKAARERFMHTWQQRERSEIQYRQSQQEYAQRQADRAAGPLAIKEWLAAQEEGRPFKDAATMVAEGLLSQDAARAYQSMQNALQQSSEYQPVMNLENQQAYAALRVQASRGELDVSQHPAYVRQFGEKRALALLAADEKITSPAVKLRNTAVDRADDILSTAFTANENKLYASLGGVPSQAPLVTMNAKLKLIEDVDVAIEEYTAKNNGNLPSDAWVGKYATDRAVAMSKEEYWLNQLNGGTTRVDVPPRQDAAAPPTPATPPTATPAAPQSAPPSQPTTPAQPAAPPKPTAQTVFPNASVAQVAFADMISRTGGSSEMLQRLVEERYGVAPEDYNVFMFDTGDILKIPRTEIERYLILE